jgi:hypothetical protein
MVQGTGWPGLGIDMDMDMARGRAGKRGSRSECWRCRSERSQDGGVGVRKYRAVLAWPRGGLLFGAWLAGQKGAPHQQRSANSHPHPSRIQAGRCGALSF